MRPGTIRRFLTSLFAVTLALIYLEPFVIGIYAEYHIQRLFDDIEQLSDNTLGVRPLGYERGWFGSTGESMLTIRQTDTLEPLTIDLEHQVSHGFISDPQLLFRATFTPHLDEAFRQASGLHLPDVPLSVTTSLDIEGHSHSKLLFAPFHGLFERQNPLLLTWSAMDFGLDRSYNGRRLGLKASVSSLRLHETTTDLALRSLHYEGRIQRKDDFLWLGDHTLGLQSLEFAHRLGGRENRLQLSNPHLSFELRQQDQGLTLNLSATSDALRVNDQIYGGAGFTLEARDIDQNTLRLLNLMVFSHFTDLSGGHRTLVGILFEQMPGFAKRNPSLVLRDFRAETPDGPVTVNLNAKVLPYGKEGEDYRMDVAGELLLPQSLVMLLLESSAREQLWRESGRHVGPGRIDLAPIKQRQLQRLLNESMLQSAGNGYLVRFTYRDGKLLLNGRDPAPALRLGVVGSTEQNG